MRIQLTTAKLNELTIRFGLTSQRQKSIFFVNNPRFDIQSKLFYFNLKIICL